MIPPRGGGGTGEVSWQAGGSYAGAIRYEAFMITQSHSIRLDTRGDDHVVDLTGRIQELVGASGISLGQATAMVVGSTAALTTLEFEPGLARHDLAAALERLAPREGHYRHEETWHDDNGHSHLRAALLGPSLALPIRDGAVPLGTWQQVVLVDLDTRPRQREVVLNLLGTA